MPSYRSRMYIPSNVKKITCERCGREFGKTSTNHVKCIECQSIVCNRCFKGKACIDCINKLPPKSIEKINRLDTIGKIFKNAIYFVVICINVTVYFPLITNTEMIESVWLFIFVFFILIALIIYIFFNFWLNQRVRNEFYDFKKKKNITD